MDVEIREIIHLYEKVITGNFYMKSMLIGYYHGKKWEFTVRGPGFTSYSKENLEKISKKHNGFFTKMGFQLENAKESFRCLSGIAP